MKSVPTCVRAPTVLAVADLHVENFGTWRDGDDRLIWGINDFDEAFPLPYTNDLVRLAASAMLAIAEKQLTLAPKEACEARVIWLIVLLTDWTVQAKVNPYSGFGKIAHGPT